jgi:2-oxoglutarate dehydrogenase E2 component (dihydrolipoamide succinyltransferase)
MSLELKVPGIGESIQEATVGLWKKAEGDFVAIDEPLVEIESEKATLEVPSPGAGVLKKILRKQGDTVTIGEVLAEIDDAAKPDGKADNKSDKAKAKPTNGEKTKPAAAAVESTAPTSPALAAAAIDTAGVRGGPAARRMMAETGLSVEEVKGSGRGGRIQTQDVVRALDERKAPEPVVTRPTLPPSADEGQERIVPMTPLRKTIARRLVEAKNTAAMLTTFNEIDMSNVLALREKYQDRFTKQHGVKLGFMSFFVKAAIEALRSFPAVNAEIRGTDIVYKDHYDIGVAVGGGKGLVVPVVREADRMSFADLEKTIAGLAVRAKENKLQMPELEGGTFTISNGGIYGSMMSTPILNPPQSGILGLHAIQKRAMVVDDAVVIRPMMYVALSYDHRLVDGREAVQFLVRVKDCIETPERILLEV